MTVIKSGVDFEICLLHCRVLFHHLVSVQAMVRRLVSTCDSHKQPKVNSELSSPAMSHAQSNTLRADVPSSLLISMVANSVRLTL